MPRFEFSCQLRFPLGHQVAAEWATNALLTALVGPSGAGKSTLLAILAGLRRPDTGFARIEGRPSPLFDLTDPRRPVWTPPEHRGIGYVIQDHLLFPHLTVEQNLRYGMARHSHRPPIDFAGTVERLGLKSLLRRRPARLSGGECQRVALGRALLSRPDLLLLDEPFAAIDKDLRERLIRDLGETLLAQQLPAVYVTHREEELSLLAATGVSIETIRLARPTENT